MASMMSTVAVAQAPAKLPADRWVLIYSGGPSRPHYSVDDLVHTVAVTDTLGQPTGWLMNGAILLELTAQSGRHYVPAASGSPSSGTDWSDFLDSIYATNGTVARLDSAVEVVERAAGALPNGFVVVQMIPYPNPSGAAVKIRDHSYNLAVDKERDEAVSAFVEASIKRFQTLSPTHLHLDGFYWLNEGAQLPDTALIHRVATSLHQRGLRFYWIPAYGAKNATNWKSLGFDAAWQQPNYFFHSEIPQTRIDSAIAIARASGMGLELEFDRRLLGSSSAFWDRLSPYLSALETAPDLRGLPITVYEGGGGLMQLSRVRQGWRHDLYLRLVQVLTEPAVTTATQ